MAFKDNVVIVVAGASGDLAKKKTFPALFALYRHGYLDPKATRIVGYARTKMDDSDYKQRLSSYFKLEGDAEAQAKAEEFKALCTYISGQYDQDDGFQALDKHINELDSSANRLFYLALPPSVFGQVAARVNKNCHGQKECRIIIEKPFGHDLDSYRDLQKEIGPVWDEKEVYRIDHYLGKEMVKSLLPLRFNNQLFKQVWNRENIEHVEVMFKEPFGTEGRGGYFDEIGIIRDVMQNHLLQVLSLLAMEEPQSFEPEPIRDAKVHLLESIKPIDLNKVVLGQYDKSEDGSKPAYVDDDTVPQGSKCCTFAAFEVDIDNEQWRGVPFVLSAGKALNEGKVEVVVSFKGGNQLVIRVQPNESIFLRISTRAPGFSPQGAVADAELNIDIKQKFPGARIPEAYEALILDALNGDHANFVRDDELDVSWRLFSPLLHHIEQSNPSIEMYPYGSTGPDSVRQVLKSNL